MIIGITGAGAMAHEVKRLAEERASGGEDISICGMYEPLGGKSISEAFGRVPDVIIDFSNPAAIYDICDYAEEQGTALVIATTGCSEAEVARIKQASESVPVVFSANYSLGITVLEKIVEEVTEALGTEFDIEIVEKHHRRKADAPSGTAILLANAVNSSGRYEFTHGRFGSSKRTKTEIGIHAVRGGGIVGEHSVIFAGDDEVIELSHHAGSRRIFAAGALKAAGFAVWSPPAIYGMRDVLWTQNQ